MQCHLIYFEIKKKKLQLIFKKNIKFISAFYEFSCPSNLHLHPTKKD